MYKSLRQRVLKKRKEKNKERNKLYRLTHTEYLQIGAKGGLVWFLFCYFFYHSYWAILPLFPIIYLYVRQETGIIRERKKELLREQFKEEMLVIEANLKAGYSLENAIKNSCQDMEHLYGETSIIMKILKFICNGIANQVPVEQLLSVSGRWSEIEDIRQFAEVCTISKLTGGNLTTIIEDSVNLLQMKMETDREIAVMLSARRMEQRIMNIVPFGIIFYISATSRGFFDVLYRNPVGIVIMTFCLLLYLIAYSLSVRFCSIHV